MKVQKGWHAIATSRELRAGKPLGLRRFGEDWLLWRDAAGRPVAMQDRCPHRGAKLSLGDVANGSIACPYHGIAFDRAGACRHVPELGRAAPGLRVATAPAVEARDFVWVWIGGGAPPEGSPPWFDNLASGFAWSGIEETWPAPYARWVENELDITHLPYVHARSIGRGRDPAARSRFEHDASGIRIYFDQRDPASREHTFIDFRFPNIWQLAISPRMYQVIAFVPLEEDRTMIYLRTYQRFATGALLRRIVAPVLQWFNRRVLAEDRRVVLTACRGTDADVAREVLFREDTAIRHYRSLMDEFVDTTFAPPARPPARTASMEVRASSSVLV